MALTRERVLQVLNQRGPSVPAEMTSQLKENTFIVGAFLSELVSQKEVFMTHAKMGGSSLYYTPHHQKNIVRLRQYLNEKERTAYDALEKNGVLRDDELTPLERTCMRNLRDFALPVKVRYSGQELLFWRWFLLEQEHAQQAIEKKLQVSAPQEKSPLEKAPEVITTNASPDPSPEPSVSPPQIQAPPQTVHEQPTRETPIATPPQQNDDEKKQIPSLPKQHSQQQSLLHDKQPIDEKTANDAFFKTVRTFLDKKNISISSANILRANSEIELIVGITSSVGSLTYYARARKKKTCNEGDIATAVVQGQLRHLPVLFMCTGKITKKAKQIIDKEYTMVTVIEEISNE